MSAFTTYSRLQQENEGRREQGGRGRRDQHRCHSLVKALQCWWAPVAASLWTGDISYQITLTAATTGQTDVSNTKCAHLVTDTLWQQPDKKTLTLTLISITRKH